MLSYTAVFFLSLCVGSFLNVCIYRLPLKLSIVVPRSFCPNCKKPVAWYDNIPLVSYLLLKGKCRGCAQKISPRYPVVELITGVLLTALFWKYGLTLSFFKSAFFFSILIVMSFIDIDYHAIPMYLTVVGITAGLIFSLYETVIFLRSFGWAEWSSLPLGKASSAMVVGFGFTYMFKFFADAGLNAYLSWKKKESIEGETESLGLGDVDFMGMAALFMGWKAAVLTFFLAPFCALGYTVWALCFKKSHVIPYLPYLSLGAAVVFFWGDAILDLFYLL